MDDSSDVAYLKPYIQSSIDAASRFRRVLIVMVTVSILAFGAAWNSRRNSWFNLRLVLTLKAEQYLTLKDKSFRLAQIERTAAPASSGTAATPDTKKLQEEKESLLREANNIVRSYDPQHTWLNSSVDIDSESLGPAFNDARKWVAGRGFYETAQARQYAQALDQARITNIVLLRTPLVGTIFDVDDLGLVGGFALMTLLLMFRFTLWREYNNLWVTFRQARTEHLEYCYRSLAMQQVLTVPPALAGSRPPQKPLGKVVRLLYFLPLFVQVVILLNDLGTIDLGIALNPWATGLSLSLGALWLIFTCFLTMYCFQLSISIDKEWQKWASKARRPSMKSQA